MWIESRPMGCAGRLGGTDPWHPFLVRHRPWASPVNSFLEPSLRNQPAALAWIGRAPERPGGQGTNIAWFDDSDDFLLSPQAFDFPCYVVCLEQQGVPGLDLIRLIRRRSSVGVLAISNPRDEGFVAALDAGADMVLRQGVPGDHLRAAIQAVARRSGTTVQSVSQAPWRLLEADAVLQAPDGTRIALGESDLAVMRCFALAEGGRVARRALIESLWGDGKESMDNALHVTLYRLRKRIEQAGQALVPVHSVSKVGYEFRAPLVLA